MEGTWMTRASASNIYDLICGVAGDAASIPTRKLMQEAVQSSHQGTGPVKEIRNSDDLLFLFWVFLFWRCHKPRPPGGVTLGGTRINKKFIHHRRKGEEGWRSIGNKERRWMEAGSGRWKELWNKMWGEWEGRSCCTQLQRRWSATLTPVGYRTNFNHYFLQPFICILELIKSLREVSEAVEGFKAHRTSC